MPTIRLEEVMKLKAGENSHLDAELLAAVDEDGKALRPNIYSEEYDSGAKVRKKGWTNIGDISACLKTSVGLGEIYDDSTTPHIAVAAKHTRPVVIAKAKTQLEATVKAIAGDLNSPFGGFWGFNTPLEYETAKFLNRMFFEGILAPTFDDGTSEMLQDTSKVKAHANRFLIETGYLTSDELNVFGYTVQPVVLGYFIKQSLEPVFDAGKETVVVTGNDGNSDISSLDAGLVEDIEFAGNASIYINSNLIFYVHDGAIAGLGDGCGARVFAARKARNMLEDSAYAALSANRPEEWERVLYDTPFTREDFKGIKMPLRLTAFSDAFFPKLDGFIETVGLDRGNKEFEARQVRCGDGSKFIPKRNNFDIDYNDYLTPDVVVQPGGCMGDKEVVPMAEKYGIKMVFTMTPEMHKKYQAGERATGRRFFGHMTM